MGLAGINSPATALVAGLVTLGALSLTHNLPTEPLAKLEDELIAPQIAALKQRGILYGPDFIVNAGGVIRLAGLYLGMTEAALDKKIEQIDRLTAFANEQEQELEVRREYCTEPLLVMRTRLKVLEAIYGGDAGGIRRLEDKVSALVLRVRVRKG